MYENYFGLAERPFDLSPNPRFLFLSKRHAEALAHLRYGLTGRPGLTVLIGEAGTGKTTLVHAALQTPNRSASTASVVNLSNPTLTRSEFYEYLAAGFGFSAAAARSKTSFLSELESRLGDLQALPAGTALVVDEAQSLPHELLEEIRLLTNVQAHNGRSLTVALVGQPELAVRLNEERLRQLKQRIVLRCELAALDLQETAAYISTRIRVAGGRPEMVLTREAVATIYEYSRGIPRTISVICDNAFVNGFAADCKPVDRAIVLEVCRDFQLSEPPRPSPQKMPVSRPAPAVQAEHRAPAATLAKPVETSEKSRGLFSLFERRRHFFATRG